MAKSPYHPQIARCFDVEQVLYEPWEYDGLRVSRSKLMTSKEKSIVPAQYVEIYAANRGTTLQEIVARQDEYSYHMMNIIDYFVGNTDRHWENWGFRVNNSNNRLEKLHPLMDFNHAFCSYDTLEGAKCLTTKKNMSQKDAAILGVQKIGLNQTADLPADLPEFFRDLNNLAGTRLDIMFMKRLELLRETAESRD